MHAPYIHFLYVFIILSSDRQHIKSKSTNNFIEHIYLVVKYVRTNMVI